MPYYYSRISRKIRDAKKKEMHMTGEPDELRREMQGYFALAFGLARIVWRGIGPYFFGPLGSRPPGGNLV
jgi:hypothetical protein